MKSPRSKPPMAFGSTLSMRGDGTGNGGEFLPPISTLTFRIASRISFDAICPICWFANVR